MLCVSWKAMRLSNSDSNSMIDYLVNLSNQSARQLERGGEICKTSSESVELVQMRGHADVRLISVHADD